MSPKDISKSPGLVNVNLYGKDFEDLIKLRILRWGDCPGLSVWALNARTSVLRRERQREICYTQRRR